MASPLPDFTILRTSVSALLAAACLSAAVASLACAPATHDSGAGGGSATGGSGTGGGSGGDRAAGTGGGSASGGGAVASGGLSGASGGAPAGTGGRGSGGAGVAGSGGAAVGTGGRGSGGAAVGSGGASGASAVSGCAPVIGIPYSYACWPMPNPATTGLPHPASYTDMGDGTVKDNVTGLLWQKAVTATQAFTWDAAKSYCASLALAGRTWRLPTRIELLSIVDFTRTSPALNVTAFPGTPGGKFHWTSSPWVVSQLATKPQYSWIVNFYEGLTSNAGDRTQAQFARCVSSSVGPGPLPALYSQVAPGEIQDNLTGLIWQQASSPTAVPFADAAGICAALSLNGHAWRLPSIKELSTLVNETPPITKVSPAIDTATFPDTVASGAYWSSSLFNSQPATAHNPWVINFLDGFTQSSATSGRVKCVR